MRTQNPCPGCGITRTIENTYMHPSGRLRGRCKKCYYLQITGRATDPIKPTPQKVFEFIKKFWEDNLRSPTLREIAEGLDMTNIKYWTDYLVNEGKLTRERYKHAGLRPTNMKLIQTVVFD